MLNPMLLCDFYKLSHRKQYPSGTHYVYSTWTPRASRIEGIDKVVAFGYQAFIQEWLIDYFNECFFAADIEVILEDYAVVICGSFGLSLEQAYENVQHIRDLHALGYLPVRICAVPEGKSYPIRTPVLTIENTDPAFFWVTNYLESLMSCCLWQPATSATIALHYGKLLHQYAKSTSIANIPPTHLKMHDFSMRGMSSLQSACTSGAGHLLVSPFSDNIPAIMYMTYHYLMPDSYASSVPATEHSVQCSYADDEEYLRRMLELYPDGIFSIVCDGYDFWKFVMEILPKFKDQIMARTGTVVIRPDSGDPVKMLCGDNERPIVEDFSDAPDLEYAKKQMLIILRDKVCNETAHGEGGEDEPWGLFKHNGLIYKLNAYIYWGRHDKKYYFIDDIKVESCEPYEPEPLKPEEKGLVKCLWDIFGGTRTPQGYRQLDGHIGVIYGDAITYERADLILHSLKVADFASTNVMLGVGSFTYQYNTRDTFGFALKSTVVGIDDEMRPIYKDPKTDDGTKKSQRGFVVVNEDGTYTDGLTTVEQLKLHDELQPIFQDGELLVKTSFAEIKERVMTSLLEHEDQ